MGFLTGTDADAKRLQRAMDVSERIEPLLARPASRPARPFSSVWVRPTAAAVSGVCDGVFVRWNNTTNVWDSTTKSCLIRERAGGRLVVGLAYLGRIVGSDADGIPIVQVTSGAGDTSGDCSGIVGILRTGSCMSMSIVEVLGACACIDSAQTASLTYDSDEAALTSEDLLYGCPPGVLTTICADDGLNTGAPDKWNIVVAGFGAPNTNLNQSYTLTHTTGEVWVGVKNGVTVTATRTLTGWTLSIDDGAVTVTYDTVDAFCCAEITFDLDDDDGTTTAPATLDMTVATACGNGSSYTARLEKVASDCGLCLKFSWVPTAGSGSRTIPWAQVGCGTDGDGSPYIEFATDDVLICTGDVEECGENRVVVRLTCVPCDQFATSGIIPCSWGDQCSGLDSLDTFTIPHSLCVSYELTAGTDCASDEGYYALDGRVNSIPLVAGPYANPMTNGFLGQHPDVEGASPCLEEGIGWSFVSAHTTLSGGAIFAGTSADQCGIADGDGNGIASSPLTIRFNSGGAFEYTVSYEGGEWLLTYTSTTLTATEFDDVAQTVTFDTSTLAGVFGQDEVTFTVGGLPLLYYGDYDGSRVTELHTRAAGAGYEYVFNSAGGIIWLCEDRTPAFPLPEEPGLNTLTADACFLLTGDDEVRTDATCVTSTYTVTIESGVDCVENPPVSSYNCIPGTGCVEVFDGSGEYPTEAECALACSGGGSGIGTGCGACLLLGEIPTLVISAGPDAGTYPGTAWAVGAGVLDRIITTFDLGGGNEASAYCDTDIGVAYLSGEGLAGTQGGTAGTTECGPPAVMTFSWLGDLATVTT